MKKLLALSLLLAIAFFGCSEQNSLVGPTASQSREFIEISPSSSLAKTTTFSGTINGAAGGEILINAGGPKAVSGNLLFPAGAFDGEETFAISVNQVKAYIDFSPSPFEFSEDLSFNIAFYGVNLHRINPDEVLFGYFGSNGEFVDAGGTITVDQENNVLSVQGAVISHFSRYGFTR